MIKKYTEFFDAYNRTGDYNSAIKDLKRSLQGIARVQYVQTDGWRGYYKATPIKKNGYKVLHDDNIAGWLTGEWDDAPAGTQQRDYDRA